MSGPWPGHASLHDAVIRRNLAPPALPRPVLAAQFARALPHPVGSRIASWARFLHERGDVTYGFGDDETGYVAEGRLVDDRRTDCMLFTMRVLDLAQSMSPEAAIERAVTARFPGIALDEIVDSSGRVDYDHPDRRRFALDLMQEGYYGTDVTTSLGSTVADPGTWRPLTAGVPVIPKLALDRDRLIDGDVLWFVLDPELDRSQRVRAESGAIIGHMGIVTDVRTGAGPVLIHAASKPLPGEYEGNSVVSVALATYLARVETFSAVRITRCW